MVDIPDEPKHELAIEYNSEREAVFVHGDVSGLRYLANRISRLAEHIEKTGHQDHIHLMTPEWGGTELTGHHPQKGDSLFLNLFTVMGWVPSSGE